ETVAREVYARVYDAAVAFAADDGPAPLHLFGYVRLAYLRAINRTVERAHNGVEHVRRREVRDYGPALSREHVSRRQDERVLLAHGLAALVDDGEAIRVHVLREAHVRAVLSNGFAERAQVFRHRLRAAREQSVRRRVDCEDFRAERFEQSRRDD